MSFTSDTYMEGQNTSSSATKIIRCDEIWYDDGNIVLQVEHIQFKIHQSILAKLSSVFANMFQFPQPDSPSLANGVPVVVMCGDSAVDWKFLLLFMNWQTNLNLQFPSIPVLKALIVLGKKYEFNAIRKEAIFRLKSPFPKTLQSFDEICATKPEKFTKWIYQNFQDLVRAAEEAQLWSILPVAYYVALTYQSNVIFNPRQSIPMNHMRTLINGRLNIVRDIMGVNFRWADGNFMECQFSSEHGYEPCGEGRATMYQKVLRDLTISIDPAFNTLERTFSGRDSPPSFGLCKECVTHAKVELDSGRQTMWDRLPTYFFGQEWEATEDGRTPNKPPAYW